MEAESPPAYRYMGRSFSDSGDSSGAFSDCSSDSSGEFTSHPAAVALHRLVVSGAVESDYSDADLRALIAELDSPSAAVESLRRAAMDLRLLAKHSPENRLRIARAGAVRPLVALISHPDSSVQEHGVTAVLNLSLCEENRAPIAAAGAIRALVGALRSGTAAARGNAACALLRLAQAEGHANAVAIGRAGGIPPLVALLESGAPRGRKDAATALYALCTAGGTNRARAVEAGVVRPLLELMADPGSGMVDKAAHLLSTVAGAAEGRAATVEEGGIPVLVEVVEVGTPRQKEVAAAVLLQICEDSPVHRAAVVREGAIPPLVALSQSGTARGKQKAEALIELLRLPRSGSNLGRRSWDGTK